MVARMHPPNTKTQYISSRGKETFGFEEVVMSGLARDGGLFMPTALPDFRADLHAWKHLSYPEMALKIMRPFVDLQDATLRELLSKSYSPFRDTDVTPLRRVGRIWLLELFHGPTLAFKDVALQFLGNLFEHYLSRSGNRLNLLGATSGDTGSAAIHGVKGKKNIAIAVIFPRGRVSQIQERQMTTVPDSNIFCAAVDGSFDDCQRLVKDTLRCLDFRDRFALGSVNSINWARVLAQTVYYFHAGIRVLAATGANQMSFAVPTGNFGDIFAGYLASRMGLPIKRLILATNENDILARFFQNGIYARGKAKATLSPSMDIQVASNFERYLYYRTASNPEQTRMLMEKFEKTGKITTNDLPPPLEPEVFTAGSADTTATLQTIKEYHTLHNCLLDPHTAVGVHVAKPYLEENIPLICLATAHPAKFPKAIAQALGRDIARHETLEALKDLPARCDNLPPDPETFRNFLANHFN